MRMIQADRLFQTPFTEDIDAIIQALPPKKQILTFSATYEDEVLHPIEGMMKKPKKIYMASEEERKSKIGVTQYYVVLEPNLRPFEIARAKEERAVEVLEKVSVMLPSCNSPIYLFTLCSLADSG